MLLWEGHAFAKSLAEHKTCWCVIYRHQAEGKSEPLRDAWEKCLREEDVPKSHYWTLLFHIRCVAVTPSEQAPNQWSALAGSLLRMVLDEEEKAPGDVFLAQTSLTPALQTWTDILNFKPLSSYCCYSGYNVIAVSWMGGFEASGIQSAHNPWESSIRSFEEPSVRNYFWSLETNPSAWKSSFLKYSYTNLSVTQVYTSLPL